VPSDAANASRTHSLAVYVRRITGDLALAAELRRAEEVSVNDYMSAAEAECESSRAEMKRMKEAIDDKSLPLATEECPVPISNSQPRRFYVSNCLVGGHGQRFCEYLLQRPNWHLFPHQKWFEDEKGNAYHCPLGKRLVDFADETHFSRLAMYIKGRIWLEEKTKMWELVPDLMPDTYVINDCKWRDGREPPPDEQCPDLPWFVKEADRNWGTSVHVCRKASECMELAKPGSTYVVQQHIRDPLLTDDGRKCHIKFYVLLVCLEDGVTWRVYCFKDGYLSISPNPWSPDDISKETQVTIIRTERVRQWSHWERVYPKCKAGVKEVVRRGVEEGKLEGRLGRRQFEILSADFIVDTHDKVWLFEFNMSPVLKDKKESPKVHDADMITPALDIVVPWEEGTVGNWDLAGEFVGQAPVPKAPPDTTSSVGVEPQAVGGATPAAPTTGASEATSSGQALVLEQAEDALATTLDSQVAGEPDSNSCGVAALPHR